MTSTLRTLALTASAVLVSQSTAWAGGNIATGFSNNTSIVNTRHNLTQSSMTNSVGGAAVMAPYRNDYGEVCVYCHTPHGGNSQNKINSAPLWNRTFNNNTYDTYDTLGTSSLTAAVTQPGVNSLTCLSCHDGTLAVDSILNAPGSGRYAGSETQENPNGFLDKWPSAAGSHFGLTDAECLACHSQGAPLGGNATDFTLFQIGTDLTNDHPIGINLPVQRVGDDFNDPAASAPGIRFFDDPQFGGDGDGRPDPNEIRFYDTGDGPEVECASCHDPHGVESAGPGSQFNPTFLRRSNDGSAVCQTCHNK